ncbi:MAG: c-type cytochrome [Gemmobacter sp.]
MSLATRTAAKTLFVTLALVATVAVAKEGVQDPTVKARMDLMSQQGKAMGVLGGMAQGKTPFDAAAAAAARETLIATGADIAAKFETEADDPVSEATPQIWLMFDDFSAKAEAMTAAATAMDVSSLDAVKAGMGAVGGTCQACHSEYRAKR